MSIKTIDVFTCDHEGCMEVARYGVLPEGWVWAAWRRDMATNNPQQPTVKKATEHHFCGEADFKAWKKENSIPDREVQSSLDKVKPEPIHA